MTAASLGPRLVVAGTHSGVGKTTVATGLIAALRRAGHRPAAAKVGPDFIDPGYHSLASGRPPRNLDPWLCGPDAIAPLAGRAAAGRDILVV
jgi:cobyrinic acid a,c-diamide synthase